MEDRELTEVLERIKAAEDYTRPWHNNIERWRKLYNGNHYDTPPKKNETRFVDPTYINAIDLATGIMLGNQVLWRASTWTPSKAGMESAGYVEKFLAGAWFMNSQREESHLLYDLFLHFNRDAGAAIYSVWDGEIAESAFTTVEVPDAESETGTSMVSLFTELPLRIQVIDPSIIFLLPGGPRRWQAIGRTEKRTVFDIETTYGIKVKSAAHLHEHDKRMTTGKFVDYWEYAYKKNEFGNKKLVVRNCVMFDGIPIPGYELREMPGYDDLAYSVQFFKPTSKTKSAEWNSLIQPLEGTVSLLERSVNRRQHQIDVYSGLPMVVRAQPGRSVSVDSTYGKSVNLAADESIEFPTWPGNAPDVQHQLDLFSGKIQQSGFSDVMYGSGASQVAGYALSQLGDQNRIRLEMPIEHLELLLSTWAKKALSLCASFSGDTQMRIYGSMRGSDFIEHVKLQDVKSMMVRAEIQPHFPNEEVRKHAMGTQTKGTLSETTRMEKYFGIEQPDDEMEKIDMERASNHPAVQQYAIMSTLQEWADDGDPIAAKVLQSMQKNGIPGEETPDNAPNPEQLTGTQSPTGEATPQAQGRPPYGQSIEDEVSNMGNLSPNMGGTIG